MIRFTSASSSKESMPLSPKWSERTLSTAPTSTERVPMPARSSPPRATSSTATSMDGSLSTIRVATGPVMSPSTVRWPSMYTPSVVVSPGVMPPILQMCASMRAVVVLPLVPVTAASGTVNGVPGGKSISITGFATSRGRPSLGALCMRNPGAAFTSQMAPPCLV